MTLVSEAPSLASSNQATIDRPQQTWVDGGCLCGEVRYRLASARARTMVCHCRACQKQSGSAFSVLLALPAADLQLEGRLRTCVTVADSGREVHRRYCGHCGSPVLTELPARPGLAVIKAGTLDDPSWLQPALHVWCKSAQPWVALPAEVPCYQEQPL